MRLRRDLRIFFEEMTTRRMKRSIHGEHVMQIYQHTRGPMHMLNACISVSTTVRYLCSNYFIKDIPLVHTKQTCAIYFFGINLPLVNVS